MLQFDRNQILLKLLAKCGLLYTKIFFSNSDGNIFFSNRKKNILKKFISEAVPFF